MEYSNFTFIYRYILLGLLCLNFNIGHSQCNVEISAEVVQCNDIANTFNALITVSGNGTGVSFVLGGDGFTYGSFAYSSSPIEIGPFSNDGTIHNFAAIDNTTLTCFGETEILPYDECTIECSVEITDVEFMLCDGLARYANVYIEQGDNVGNSFVLLINQVNIGTFNYGQEFYTIGPLTGDCTTGIGVNVFDTFHTGCADFYWQPGPWCCPDECVINDIIVNTYCVDDEVAGIIVDFNYNGNSNEKFEIILDSVTVDTTWVYEFPDTFFYNFIGAAPDTIFQGFGVSHVAKPDCGFYNEYELTCNSTPLCSFSNVVLSPITCDGDGAYSLGLDFQIESASSIYFDVFSDNTHMGAYLFSDLPIVINNFPERDAELDIIRLVDNGNNNCSETIEFQGLDCAAPTCSFSNYFIEAHECDDNGLFNMYIQFDVQGEGDEGFIVRGNGIIYDTFEYGQGWHTFGPLVGDCESIYEFIVIDIENPSCQIAKEFDEPICCEVNNCMISDLTFNDWECVDGNMGFNYHFNFSGTTDPLYDLMVNGEFIGTYEFQNLQNENYIEVPGSSSEVYLVTICENDNPDCCITSQFEGSSCAAIPDCVISQFFIEAGDCNDDGLFFVDIEFNIENPASTAFTVFGDGNNYGSFNYGETFYTIGPFEGDCQSIYEFIVVDNDNQDCASNYLFLGPICCDIEECAISNLVVTAVECDTESEDYYISIDFNTVGADNDFFDVIVNNEIISFHALTELPIEILYPASGNEVDQLMICINDSPNCCEVVEFIALDCAIEIGDCDISSVLAEAHECDGDGFFMVDVAFEVVDGSMEGFEIRGNGISYGNFVYGQSFYTIGPLEGDCETIYEFIIIDLGDKTCSSFYGFEEAICCSDTGCNISNLQAEIISCDSSDQVFFASISFDVNNLTTQFFSVSGNGQDYGSFGYGQDSYTLGPLAADGTTLYEFIVTDLAFETCVASIEFGAVDCSTVGIDDQEFTPNISAWFYDQKITIDNPNFLKISGIRVFSLDGKYVSGIQSATSNSKIKLDLQTETNGIYLISLLVENKIHTIKLAVVK